MGFEPRISNQARINVTLRIVFILLAVVFLFMFVALPKNDCEACEFDYNGGISVREFSDYYKDSCLENKYAPKEEFYVDIDDINITDMTWNKSAEVNRSFK